MPPASLRREALAKQLRPHRLDAVVSSDLLRARTTARIVAEACGVPLFTEPGLRETDVGAAEGLLWADAKTRFGEGLTERWYSDGDVAFPGGETGIATRMRALAALRRFAAAHPYRRIGVSTHGAMMRQLMKHALPPGSTPAPARNTMLYVLRYDPADDRLVVVEREELDLDRTPPVYRIPVRRSHSRTNSGRLARKACQSSGNKQPQSG